MAKWMVVADQEDARELGEFLARSIPGEWHEERRDPAVRYALGSTIDEENKPQVAWVMADALAAFLVDVHPLPWLKVLFGRRYRGFQPQDAETILSTAVRDLHLDDEHNRDRRELAATLLAGFLSENDVVVLDGVRTFLLPEIRQEFEDALDQAVDQFLLEEEYQEFVALLRQFVAQAPGRIPTIHICRDGANFHFEDDQGQRVGDEIVQELMEGIAAAEGTPDDIMVSALITLAPYAVVIHQYQERMEHEAMRTIEAVFEGRVTFCGGCRRCRRQLTDHRQTF